jgi:hypothetical protein
MLINGCLTQEALENLEKYADLIECECPGHLIEILNKVRDFRTYTKSCVELYPDDAKTHIWLESAARNIDAMLSNTILQLARMEGFINDANELVPRESVKRSEMRK